MNLISRFRKVHDADFGFFYPVSRLVPKTMTAGFDPVKKLPSEAIGSNLKRVSLHVTLSVQLENITFCVLITRRSDVFL